jgi:hypothetical protein
MILSSRLQKERCVVELRKEGKNYQQIAKEARISVRNIKPILDKYRVDDLTDYTDGEVEKNSSDSHMSISSRAYKLFYEEGMDPIEVAIALNLEASEAKRYYNDFWELNNMESLARLYKQVGNVGASWLLRLNMMTRTKGISIDQIIEYVSIYGEDLPLVKKMYVDTNNELQAALSRKYQSEKECEFLDFKISKLVEVLRSKQTECENIERERRKLLRLKMQLASFISEFKNKNVTYREIGQLVEDKVDSLLKKNTKLLRLSLISLLRSLGKDEVYKYRYLLHELNLVEIPGSIEDNITSYSNYISASTNPFSQFESNVMIARNSTSDMNGLDRYHHSNISKRGDHCPACYESYILAMSNRYFENLKKQIANEVLSAIIKEK